MKKALLVGINRYPDPRNELKGCVNDVRQMAETLKSRYGFLSGDANLRILTDARATTKAILDGLAWLTAGASPGDTLVFHYSGHGSQVPDRNGDETTDRLDEILCPYDLDWEHPLTDEDLAAATARVPPGALLTVILDCCHSGTGLREYAISGNRHYLPALTRPANLIFSGTTIPRGSFVRPCGIPPSDAPDRHRFLPRPETLPCPDAHRPGGATATTRRPARRFGVCVTKTNAVLIAACRDDQTSADAWIDGSYHGAHTFYLCRTLANGPRDLTYRSLVSAAGTALSRAGFDQVPQLEGPARLLVDPVFLPLATAGDERCAV
ncbi:MAG: caspase family protein [Deltaproteobacteria bacterium]